MRHFAASNERLFRDFLAGSSERGFPVTAPLSFRTPAAAAYFYGHYNLGT